MDEFRFAHFSSADVERIKGISMSFWLKVVLFSQFLGSFVNIFGQ